MRAAMASNLAANAIVRKNFSRDTEDQTADTYTSKFATKGLEDDDEIEEIE